MRKDEIEGQEMQVDPSQHHVTLATMNSLGLQQALISSPTQQTVTSEQQQALVRSGIETLYSINQHNANSPQFQISRHIPENMVRHISENMLRDNLSRDNITQQTMNRHVVDTSENLNRPHLVESPHMASNESIRRQISDTTGAQPREVQEQQQQQQQQTLPPGMTVEAEGNVPVSRGGLHLLSQGVLPGSLQFTTLLNSDLVAIGEAVIRNQNGIPTMFQQKYPNQ